MAAAALLVVSPLLALDGQPGLHDPSTVIVQDGKYYVYATGGGLPMSISDDGWTWRRAGTRHAGGARRQARPGRHRARRQQHLGAGHHSVGDKYFLYYSAPGTQPKSAIGLLVGKTLDPESPDYKWEDAGPVVWSDGVEDSNAIDPGVFRDPTNGTLWLTYGSYFGYIRLVELDPKTGKRLYPDRKPVNIAINSEASIMIFRDGWYYLLVTHGSCCAGANSSYNIRMGRAKKVTGPFLDNMGIDMLQGGGKLFLGSGGRYVGPGHFGLLDLGDGVQKFSCHYEADLDRGGISVLDIRPLLWRDGWPVAGDNVTAGTYEIESARTGTALELAVQGVPVGGLRGAARPRPPGTGGRGSGGRGGDGRGGRPISTQDAAQVVGELAGRRRSTCAWLPTCCRRSRSGRSRRSPMPAATPARRTSRSRSPERIARSRRRPSASCRAARVHRRAGATVAHRPARRRHLPPDAEGGAEFDRSRWRCRPSAAACRRSPDSIPTATVSAGSSRRHDGPIERSIEPSCQCCRSIAVVDGRRLAPTSAPRTSGCRCVGPAPSLVASRDADQSAGRRRLPPALAGPRADSGAGQLTDSAVQTAGQDRVLPRSVHGASARRRHAHRRRQRAHVARGRHAQLQRQPVSLRLRAEQADVERAVLGRHRRQLAARDARRAPGHRLERRVGLVGQRQEVIGLYNDRQAVIDDGVSKRLTLKKGPNVIRAAIVNAGGATDFCARFLDNDDHPVKGLTVMLAER